MHTHTIHAHAASTTRATHSAPSGIAAATRGPDPHSSSPLLHTLAAPKPPKPSLGHTTSTTRCSEPSIPGGRRVPAEARPAQGDHSMEAAAAAAHVAAAQRTHVHEDLATEAHPDQGGLLDEYHLPSLVTHLGGGVRPSHRCLRRVAVSPRGYPEVRVTPRYPRGGSFEDFTDHVTCRD